MSQTLEGDIVITEMLNGSINSIENVVPISHVVMKPLQWEQALRIQFGVLIGFTGDARGQFVITSDSNLFRTIGETMYGMPLEGEMLFSFSGELGNMIAGGMSTNVAGKGIRIDITSPTILKGDTTLTGYKLAIQLPVIVDEMGQLDTFLLLD